MTITKMTFEQEAKARVRIMKEVVRRMLAREKVEACITVGSGRMIKF